MKAKELVIPGVDPREQAVDTLGAVLRSMAEFALQQEQTDTVSFRKVAEAWAQRAAAGVSRAGGARRRRHAADVGERPP